MIMFNLQSYIFFNNLGTVRPKIHCCQRWDVYICSWETSQELKYVLRKQRSFGGADHLILESWSIGDLFRSHRTRLLMHLLAFKKRVH